MVFVFTFAVGGGSGKVIPMPNWALVSFVFLFVDVMVFNFCRIRLEIQITVKDSHSLYLLRGGTVSKLLFFGGKSMFSIPPKTIMYIFNYKTVCTPLFVTNTLFICGLVGTDSEVAGRF